jgi:hypothetical protein
MARGRFRGVSCLWRHASLPMRPMQQAHLLVQPDHEAGQMQDGDCDELPARSARWADVVLRRSGNARGRVRLIRISSSKTLARKRTQALHASFLPSLELRERVLGAFRCPASVSPR